MANAGDVGLELYNGVVTIDDAPMTGTRSAYFRDPDGLTIELARHSFYFQEKLIRKRHDRLSSWPRRLTRYARVSSSPSNDPISKNRWCTSYAAKRRSATRSR